jgi:cytochrome c oxidase assembly protein subunit 15
LPVRKPFQTLAVSTTAATYILILVGGLVRASGAGLGCPDWPRCFGAWIPPASAAALPPGFDPSQFNPTLMWTEYLNRLLGVTVGLLIFATLIAAWRHHRRTPRVFLPTLAAFLLVGFQGWLGGVVVRQELAGWLVTVHMVVALVIVSLLLYATLYAIVGKPAARGSDASAGTRASPSALTLLMGLLMAATLVQVILGTQVRERIDEALMTGVPRSAALSTVGAVDRWHRELALLVLALSVAVLWRLRAEGRHEVRLVGRAATVMMALSALQIVLGLTLAYAALTPAAQVLHLSGASLLVGAQLAVLLLTRWQPASE